MKNQGSPQLWSICLTMSLVVIGCSTFRVDPNECVNPVVCYYDNDGDGIGSERLKTWGCPEAVPDGYVLNSGDMCHSESAINWNSVPYEGCIFQDDDCVPVDWQGITYDVMQIAGDCYFAQDLRTTRTLNGEDIAAVTGIDDFTSSGCFRNTTHPSEGYLYGVQLVFPTNKLCPEGWHPWMLSEFESSAYEIDYYSSFDNGYKKNGFWCEETGDYWGFGGVPNGIFDVNFGYVAEGEISTYWLMDDIGSIHTVHISEGNHIHIDSHNDEVSQLRAVRCVKN